MTHSATKTELGVLDVIVQLSIAAPASRVWKALLEETSSWWARDFLTNSEASGFVIDERVGGLAYEDWGDGQGLAWFSVIGLQREKMLMLAGDSNRDWGGPSRTILRVDLREEGGTTELTVTQDTFGQVGEDGGRSLDEGWQYLFGQCFKDWVESARSPQASTPAG